MSDLVSQDREDLVVRHLLDEGVEENDALYPADSGEIGVRVPASARGVDLENAAYLQSCAFHELPDLVLKSLRFERFKLEKERFNHIGGKVHDEDAEDQEECPDPEPPPERASLDEDKGPRYDRPSQDR